MGRATIAVAASMAVPVASAQQAKIWPKPEGGNGHWYQAVANGAPLCWTEARDRAIAAGGHLATITSAAEDAWICSQIITGTPGLYRPGCGWDGPMIGGFKLSGSNWQWVTGEPFSYSHWVWSNGDGPEMIQFFQQGCGWDGTGWCGGACGGNVSYIIEWSGDCNGDGIIDFGQVRNGSLADADLDNVPDCCERSSPCEYRPAQWKASDGGNGHWYQLRFGSPGLSWEASQSHAESIGGHLATLTSAAENDFVFGIANATAAYGGSPVVGPWLGGRLVGNAWTWVTGEAWGFTNWLPPNPDGPGTWNEDRTCLTSSAGRWNDFNASGTQPGIQMRAYVVEWSADCDGDGVIDYGQILRDEVPDLNGNGVPDGCECPADLDRDGAVTAEDLAAVLFAWGMSGGKAAAADVDRNGTIDGSDLSAVLAAWGACPG